jgi:hypothetical protein
VFKPTVGEGKMRTLPLQVSDQLRQKRSRHRRIRARHVRQDEDQVGRVVLDDFHHPFGPVVCKVLVPASRGQSRRNAAEVLDERQPQHDWYGPQLTKLERLNGLISGNETVDAVRVDSPVNVCDQFQGDTVDPRMTCSRSPSQPWQFATVTSRQVAPGGANLVFDKIEIVEQPFRRRRNPPVTLGGGRDEVIRLDENAFVLSQARNKFVRVAARRQPVRRRQRLRMTLQLLDAEQLRAQRLFFRSLGVQPVHAVQPSPSGQPFQPRLHCVRMHGDPFCRQIVPPKY